MTNVYACMLIKETFEAEEKNILRALNIPLIESHKLRLYYSHRTEMFDRLKKIVLEALHDTLKNI